MIDQSWIDEIVTAVNEMASASEITKLVREKLELAYEAGYADGGEETSE